MEVFAILVLVMFVAWYVALYKAFSLEEDDMRDCDCQSRDPHKCIREQCFDADDKDHKDESCKFCLDGCACECHYARKSEDSK